MPNLHSCARANCSHVSGQLMLGQCAPVAAKVGRSYDVWGARWVALFRVDRHIDDCSANCSRDTVLKAGEYPGETDSN